MARGSPANFLWEQRPRPSPSSSSRRPAAQPQQRSRSVPLRPTFGGPILGIPTSSSSLVRVSYLNRRPFYGLRTRPPFPPPSFALTCLARAECSSQNIFLAGGGEASSFLPSFGKRKSRPCSLCRLIHPVRCTCSQCAIFQGSAMSQVYNFLLPLSLSLSFAHRRPIAIALYALHVLALSLSLSLSLSLPPCRKIVACLCPIPFSDSLRPSFLIELPPLVFSLPISF